MDKAFEIFCATAPGLEGELASELRSLRFETVKPEAGGVSFRGSWPEVWRANLEVRGASRVLARIGTYPVVHMAQLDKRARRFPWADYLHRDVPVRVEVTCRKSKIYHAGAAAQRVERALKEEFGARIEAGAPVCLRVRIDHNICTLSLDSSGELLHKRGFKPEVNKAPMRETLAALFLRSCGYSGNEPVLDPMCGSGTFVIEAAEIALGLKPGRARDFAFQHFASYDSDAFKAMRAGLPVADTPLRFFGSDRDPGAVRMSQTNAEQAGVSDLCDFQTRDIAELERPEGRPGLIIINPPYGARIGNKAALYSVYDRLGQSLKAKFSGWRVGLITSEPSLAKASRLPFGKPGAVVDHGGVKVRLYQASALR